MATSPMNYLVRKDQQAHQSMCQFCMSRLRASKDQLVDLEDTKLVIEVSCSTQNVYGPHYSAISALSFFGSKGLMIAVMLSSNPLPNPTLETTLHA